MEMILYILIWLSILNRTIFLIRYKSTEKAFDKREKICWVSLLLLLGYIIYFSSERWFFDNRTWVILPSCTTFNCNEHIGNLSTVYLFVVFSLYVLWIHNFSFFLEIIIIQLAHNLFKWFYVLIFLFETELRQI